MTVIILKQINYHHADMTHRILQIHGIPFYCSSGLNSGYPDTWFPFFGIVEKDDGFLYKRGDFSKPCMQNRRNPVANKIVQLFPSGGLKLYQRFGSIPCMILSSILEGGLWTTRPGQELKAFLQSQYPQCYTEQTTYLLDPNCLVLSEIEAVNQTLKTGCHEPLHDLEDLQLPQTVADLLTLGFVGHSDEENQQSSNEYTNLARVHRQNSSVAVIADVGSDPDKHITPPDSYLA